jgi:trimeric autotransporter adhesin
VSNRSASEEGHLHRKGLPRVALVVSLAVSMLATSALALSLTRAGGPSLRNLATLADKRFLPWAPVTALADVSCQPPSTSGGGTGPPTTSTGGTGPPTTSTGGTGPPTTSTGGTGPPTTSSGGTCAPPAVVISPSTTAVCLGGSASLTALPNGGQLPETFAWTSSDGSLSSTSQTVTVSPTATTTYSVTVTDATNLTASASITIIVNPLPSVTISGTPAGAIPLGTSVTLTGSGSGGTGAYSFSWSRGTFIAPATTMDTPVLGDTSYTVTLTDANGCHATAAATVGVFDYTVSLSPIDETVLAATPATYTVNVAFVAGSHTAGAPPAVSLGITGAPASATVTAPASITLPSAGNTVSVNTSITPLGDFTIHASASVGVATRMASASLHIYDFALSVTPTTETVTLGGGPAAYTVSVSSPLPGSTAIGLPTSVGLGTTGLPGGVTPTMPTSVAFGASVPLSLAIGATSPGDYPFTVTGSVPGGARTGTADLKIAYNICVLYDQTQVRKAGSTIPIKLQLCDANGGNVSAPDIVVHAVFVQFVSGSVPPVVPDDSGDANPDSDFRFDGTIGTTGGYIFNLSTTGLTAGAWTLTFIAGNDPTLHSVQFLLR